MVTNDPAGPVGPVSPEPERPVGPVSPVVPVAPVAPVVPACPVVPVTPVAPVAPVAPVWPIAPVAPAVPVWPVEPVTPVSPVDPAIPVIPVSGKPICLVEPVLSGIKIPRKEKIKESEDSNTAIKINIVLAPSDNSILGICIGVNLDNLILPPGRYGCKEKVLFLENLPIRLKSVRITIVWI